MFERIEATDPSADHLAEGQVLLRLLAGGICGSDLAFFRGYGLPREETPRSRGVTAFPLHEVVGQVVASRAPDIVVGERVVGWAESCLALAEMVVADGESLAACGESLDPSRIVIAQPLACVISAVDRLGDVGGRSVAVLGLGPMGVLFSHVLKDRGAAVVTGVDLVDRSAEGAYFGVDEVIWSSTSQWVRTLPENDRPEIVVEAIGHQDETFVDAVEAVGTGGLIYYFGIPAKNVYPFDMTLFLRKQLTMAAGTTLRRRHYLDEALRYMEGHSGLTERYVTGTYPATQVDIAFEAASNPRPRQLKITLDLAVF